MTEKNNGAANFKCILDDAKKCIENGIYIGALDIALTIPDICGNIEYPDTTVGYRYKKWFAENVSKEESQLTYNEYRVPNISPAYDACTIYKLRCSFLHEGEPLTDYLNNRFYGGGSKIEMNFAYSGPSLIGGSSGTNWGPGRHSSCSVCLNIKELSEKLISSGRNYCENNSDKFEDFIGIEKSTLDGLK